MNTETDTKMPPRPKLSPERPQRIRTPTKGRTIEEPPLRRALPPVWEWNPFEVAKIAASIQAGSGLDQKTAVLEAIDLVRATEDVFLDLHLEDLENSVGTTYSEGVKECTEFDARINKPPGSMKVKELLLGLTDDVEKRLNHLISTTLKKPEKTVRPIYTRGPNGTKIKTLLGMLKPEAFDKLIGQMENDGEIKRGKYRPGSNKTTKGVGYYKSLMDFAVSEVDICDLIIKKAKKSARLTQKASNKSKVDREAKKNHTRLYNRASQKPPKERH